MVFKSILFFLIFCAIIFFATIFVIVFQIALEFKLKKTIKSATFFTKKTYKKIPLLTNYKKLKKWKMKFKR